jgi:hypothetical protein
LARSFDADVGADHEQEYPMKLSISALLGVSAVAMIGFPVAALAGVDPTPDRGGEEVANAAADNAADSASPLPTPPRRRRKRSS